MFSYGEIYFLDSRRNANSYILAIYEYCCKQIKLGELESRITIADAVFAFDIYVTN